MTQTEYSEYLEVVGKIKDALGLTLEVPHRDIHTFFKDKVPKFKLIYGVQAETGEAQIVLSFQINVGIVEAIQLYAKIYKIYPFIILIEVHVEDHAGETWMGADAVTINQTLMEQEVIRAWLESSDRENMEAFASAKVVGRERDLTKQYDSRHERDEALREFGLMQKALNEDEVH